MPIYTLPAVYATLPVVPAAATMGAATGVPVHGMCTLDGIAYAAGLAGLEGPFTVATDARRKEVYWAAYADPRTRLTEPAVDRPADIAERVAGRPAVGAGALLYPETFGDVPDGMPEYQSASAMAELAAARLRAGEELLPDRTLYLRRPDAQVPANYKVVTPR